MEKVKINGLDVEIDSKIVSKFLQQLTYPLVIFDFETFRNLGSRKKQYVYANDFEKIFSLALLIITEPEELIVSNLVTKKLSLFVKTAIPPIGILKNNPHLFEHQTEFFHFLISKLLKYEVKSVVLLGARTEVLVLKNYLAYHLDDNKFKNKISSFFHNNKIFDLYDIWNKDHVLNLPFFKKTFHQDIGATKKTKLLIKNNKCYATLLKDNVSLTNNDIGRIIDCYFGNNVYLLPNFKMQVAKHNQNDVLIGGAILSLLYELTTKKQ